ncbi:hypothetical protein AXG93_4265s1010 [Marchantia polymorpha subsp. ruderalis]|uniref:Uncharacterized protein n=1 Tax=Marchantia polymorpha subsp. ruderalis TaxID=1480154 RepID=A0A176VU40_MARPO|nr:hypothetical protein AXG93_4265s1010 [Marchantia polymorpha subsp. ruderalis]
MITSEFSQRPKRRRISREVNDSAAQEKSLNGDTFNLHKLEKPLRRRGLELAERSDSARVRQWWFTKATRLSRKSRDLANLGLAKVLGRYTGDDDDLTFNSENVKVGFVKRALQGDRIHWARIFWTATRQHIRLVSGGSANYLSPFLIKLYRDMGLLTIEERREFLM